jgi:type II secretory pathway pseudopilin PulG
VLVATAVAVPLTLAAAMGLLTSIRASEQAAERQELNVALTNATETLRTLPYLPCGTAEAYQQLWWDGERPRVDEPMASGAQPSAPSIESVRYWNEAKGTWVEGCEDDGGAQQVVLTVISDRLGTATGSVVLHQDATSGAGRR